MDLDSPSEAAMDTPRESSIDVEAASPALDVEPTVPPLTLAVTYGTNGIPDSEGPAPDGTTPESPSLEEVLEHLQEMKRKGTSPHWRGWSFILAPEERDEEGEVVNKKGVFLVHSVCGHGYAVKLKSNFSRVLNDHMCYKIRNKRKFCEVTDEPGSQPGSLTPGPSKGSAKKRVTSNQRAVQPFFKKDKQQDHVRTLFAKLLYENYGTVPLRLVDMFQPIFKVLGMEPITREWLAGPNLDRMYEAAVKLVKQVLKDAEYVQFTFDGLSEASSASGEKRINCLALIPGRPALYLGVVHVKEESIDADYLTELMVKLAKSVIGDAGGNLTRKACGFLFDSEVVDKAAATALERLYPHLTNVPCQAHCGVSLMKDIQEEVPCVAEVLASCRLIAKVMEEHSSLRKAFFTAAKKHATSTIPPRLHSEMRFDGKVLTANECLAASESLREIFLVEDFGVTYSQLVDNLDVQEVCHMLEQPYFFEKVLMVQELLTVLSDHIYHMESERPAIPQLRDIWTFLEAHFIAWEAKYGEENVLESMLALRMENNYIDAFPTAYLLDPAYCVRIKGGFMVPPYNELKAHEKRQVDRHLITRSDGKGSKVAAELVAFITSGYLNTTVAGVVSKSLNNDVTKPLEQRLQCWDGDMAKEYPFLCREARRLIGMHSTCCDPARKWVQPQFTCQDNRAQLISTRTSKMLFIANCKALDSSATVVSTEEMDNQVLCTAALESENTGDYLSDFAGSLMLDFKEGLHDDDISV